MSKRPPKILASPVRKIRYEQEVYNVQRTFDDHLLSPRSMSVQPIPCQSRSVSPIRCDRELIKSRALAASRQFSKRLQDRTWEQNGEVNEIRQNMIDNEEFLSAARQIQLQPDLRNKLSCLQADLNKLLETEQKFDFSSPNEHQQNSQLQSQQMHSIRGFDDLDMYNTAFDAAINIVQVSGGTEELINSFKNIKNYFCQRVLRNPTQTKANDQALTYLDNKIVSVQSINRELTAQNEQYDEQLESLSARFQQLQQDFQKLYADYQHEIVAKDQLHYTLENLRLSHQNLIIENETNKLLNDQQAIRYKRINQVLNLQKEQTKKALQSCIDIENRMAIELKQKIFFENQCFELKTDVLCLKQRLDASVLQNEEFDLRMDEQKRKMGAEIDRLKVNDVNVFISAQSRNIGDNLGVAVNALLKLSRSTKDQLENIGFSSHEITCLAYFMSSLNNKKIADQFFEVAKRKGFGQVDQEIQVETACSCKQNSQQQNSTSNVQNRQIIYSHQEKKLIAENITLKQQLEQFGVQVSQLALDQPNEDEMSQQSSRNEYNSTSHNNHPMFSSPVINAVNKTPVKKANQEQLYGYFCETNQTENSQNTQQSLKDHSASIQQALIQTYQKQPIKTTSVNNKQSPGYDFAREAKKMLKDVAINDDELLNVVEKLDQDQQKPVFSNDLQVAHQSGQNHQPQFVQSQQSAEIIGQNDDDLVDVVVNSNELMAQQQQTQQQQTYQQQTQQQQQCNKYQNHQSAQRIVNKEKQDITFNNAAYQHIPSMQEMDLDMQPEVDHSQNLEPTIGEVFNHQHQFSFKSNNQVQQGEMQQGGISVQDFEQNQQYQQMVQYSSSIPQNLQRHNLQQNGGTHALNQKSRNQHSHNQSNKHFDQTTNLTQQNQNISLNSIQVGIHNQEQQQSMEQLMKQQNVIENPPRDFKKNYNSVSKQQGELSSVKGFDMCNRICSNKTTDDLHKIENKNSAYQCHLRKYVSESSLIAVQKLHNDDQQEIIFSQPYTKSYCEKAVQCQIFLNSPQELLQLFVQSQQQTPNMIDKPQYLNILQQLCFQEQNSSNASQNYNNVLSQLQRDSTNQPDVKTKSVDNIQVFTQKDQLQNIGYFDVKIGAKNYQVESIANQQMQLVAQILKQDDQNQQLFVFNGKGTKVGQLSDIGTFTPLQLNELRQLIEQSSNIQVEKDDSTLNEDSLNIMSKNNGLLEKINDVCDQLKNQLEMQDLTNFENFEQQDKSIANQTQSPNQNLPQKDFEVKNDIQLQSTKTNNQDVPSKSILGSYIQSNQNYNQQSMKLAEIFQLEQQIDVQKSKLNIDSLNYLNPSNSHQVQSFKQDVAPRKPKFSYDNFIKSLQIQGSSDNYFVSQLFLNAHPVFSNKFPELPQNSFDYIDENHFSCPSFVQSIDLLFGYSKKDNILKPILLNQQIQENSQDQENLQQLRSFRLVSQTGNIKQQLIVQSSFSQVGQSVKYIRLDSLSLTNKKKVPPLFTILSQSFEGFSSWEVSQYLQSLYLQLPFSGNLKSLQWLYKIIHQLITFRMNNQSQYVIQQQNSAFRHVNLKNQRNSWLLIITKQPEQKQQQLVSNRKQNIPFRVLSSQLPHSKQVISFRSSIQPYPPTNQSLLHVRSTTLPHSLPARRD